MRKVKIKNEELEIEALFHQWVVLKEEVYGILEKKDGSVVLKKSEDFHFAKLKNVARQESFDFESLYKQYPRKMGKDTGIKKCKTQIKTEIDYNNLKKAIDKFNRYHSSKGTDEQFIPYFGTFMNSWRSWLDDETGQSKGFDMEFLDD